MLYKWNSFLILFLGELIILKETELKMIVLLNMSCFYLFACFLCVFELASILWERFIAENQVYKGEITDERLKRIGFGRDGFGVPTIHMRHINLSVI